MTLEETIQLLVKYRVTKFKGSVGAPMPGQRALPPELTYAQTGQVDVELELHPLAFAGPADPDTKQGAFGTELADKKCNCGHPLTEHSEHGLCLQGCSTDVCGLGDAHP